MLLTVLLLILTVCSAAALLQQNPGVNGQGQLSKETTPSPSVPGETPGQVSDDQDLDLSIDPVDPILFENGTVTMSTAGATDLDINSFPPVGVSVLIQNETVSVTKNPVTIEGPATTTTTAAAAAAPAPADTGSSSDEDEE